MLIAIIAIKLPTIRCDRFMWYSFAPHCLKCKIQTLRRPTRQNAVRLPWWWRHCCQCCEGSRGAIRGTMTARPGTCRGCVFACWHSAVVLRAMARQVRLRLAYGGTRRRDRRSAFVKTTARQSGEVCLHRAPPFAKPGQDGAAAFALRYAAVTIASWKTLSQKET
jgi:hypothetical protein